MIQNYDTDDIEAHRFLDDISDSSNRWRFSHDIKVCLEFNLSYLKEDAYVINTARSNLIDNQELFNLLKNGKILGAALDVFDIEPLEKENEFLKLNNVTLTNHRAGDTLDSYIKSPLMLVEKLKKYIEL